MGAKRPSSVSEVVSGVGVATVSLPAQRLTAICIALHLQGMA